MHIPTTITPNKNQRVQLIGTLVIEDDDNYVSIISDGENTSAVSVTPNGIAIKATNITLNGKVAIEGL